VWLDGAVLGLAGVDDIDINFIRVAGCSEAFGEICHRRVDRTADEEIRPWRVRGTTDDIDDIAMDLLEQRPEQPRKPDGGVQFQRKAVGPQGIRLLEKIATEGRSLTRTSQRLKCSLTLAKTCSQASNVRRSPATVTACGPPTAPTAIPR